MAQGSRRRWHSPAAAKASAGLSADPVHPALVEARAHPRRVHFGDDADPARDDGGLALGPAHAPQARAHEQPPGQVLLRRDPELGPAGVQEGAVGPVHDALRPDVHPAPGGHLPVVGHSERHRAVPVLLVVEAAHHERVGDDHPRRLGRGGEEPDRVAGGDHERLLARQHFEVTLDQPVLHPVLADLPGLAVGHELIGVERDLEVQVVVDHDLEGPAFDAAARVMVERAAGDRPRRPEAVAVDAAAGGELPQELRGQRRVPFRRHVAQRVLQRELGVRPREVEAAHGRAADARGELRLGRQPVAHGLEPDGHGVSDDVVGHHFAAPVAVIDAGPTPSGSPPRRPGPARIPGPWTAGRNRASGRS